MFCITSSTDSLGYSFLSFFLVSITARGMRGRLVTPNAKEEPVPKIP